MAIRFVLGVLLVLAMLAGRDALAGPFPDCPDDAKKEFGLFLGARFDTTPCACNTIITCLNLDRKSVRVKAEFYLPASTNPLGTATAVQVPPGHSWGLAMGVTSPLGIILPDSHASIVSPAIATARVCATSKKLACRGTIECDCHSAPSPGPAMLPLQPILKKQKGS